ncbi:MAG: type II toxin-antitoxin system Phd/YefM family antitoxin [Thermodesulfobacteriota bacterium]
MVTMLLGSQVKPWRCAVPQTVSKSQFKPRSLEYFRRIEETGEELVITDHGRPVLKVVPYIADPEACSSPWPRLTTPAARPSSWSFC